MLVVADNDVGGAVAVMVGSAKQNLFIVAPFITITKNTRTTLRLVKDVKAAVSAARQSLRASSPISMRQYGQSSNDVTPASSTKMTSRLLVCYSRLFNASNASMEVSM